jgi:hypothetical protein
MYQTPSPYQPTPPPPPRKRHLLRWFLTSSATLIVLIIVIATLASSPSQHPAAAGTTAPAAPAAAPATSAPATPAAPAPASPTYVEFVVTGHVPASEFGQVDISFGSNTATHDKTLPAMDGRRVYRMKFDGSAEYYSLNVDFTSAGSVSCAIIAGGPGDQPLTVAHGSADSAGDNSGGLCSAQAAPTDSSGLHWQSE